MSLNPGTTKDAASPFHNDNAAEIPFLVTHWLANYETKEKKEEHLRAIQRIRKATSDIASAFASLGAYGTAFQPTLGSSFLQPSLPKNATYADLNRQWSGLSTSHLENLVHAVATNNAVADSAAAPPTNLLQASGEVQKQTGGRTLRDAIEVDDNQKNGLPITSALQSPVLIASKKKSTDSTKITDAERSSSPIPTMEMRSLHVDVAQETSDSMRQFLNLREKVKSNQREIKTLKVAISKQEENGRALSERFHRISNDSCMEATEKLQNLDEIKTERQVSGRVITQLQRKLTELQEVQERDSPELVRLDAQVRSLDTRRKSLIRNYRDPFSSQSAKRNSVLHTVLGRQQGIPTSRPHRNLNPSGPIFSGAPRPTHFAATRKSLICTRLSHAATINSHLSYPIYCLRFDRTGRYFITGADDYLIKVFYLGAGQSCRNKNQVDGSRQLRCSYGANLPGAVLVCSLRGHAGVINDIDVSADNCFLATASVDGDVRVWGLRDGCPVAVLRGHKGGANMVSWSTLTPYRLVSTGSDGYARQWDVREACLKRCGRIVGRREEYRLRLTASEKVVQDSERRSNNVSQARTENLLPPLPVREADTVAAPARAPSPVRVIIPPLPAGVPPLPGSGQNNAERNAGGPENEDADNNQAPGQFVANDVIDEGVKLLEKFKHGATGDDAAGPGTRARRAAVKVICIARSPVGGHFTTGCDDGICRVWPDSEESRVEVVDRRKLENIFVQSSLPTRQEKTRSRDQPLLQLMGHVSAITDLSYSHTGDRILSASQKEGVIRVWSLGEKLAALTRDGARIEERGISHIVIRLTNPASSNQPKNSSRRRPGHSSQSGASKVSCDVAVWSHDDSKVLTSQSVLVKQSGAEVRPGSQFLFLWDSLTGQCLMGISGAHSMQCPVVIPHPTDSSLVCTAGADGFAKVWDWETGRCVFTHQNRVEFGPSADPSDKNKTAGYLDGSFSPDGTTLVLTDDDGRITILDCASKTELESSECPSWMREQYFANDYYELFYDRNGYCIERGSERPPHLAPRGVRCNHSGSPYSDEVNEAFARGRLIGPMPLPEHMCRWRRNHVRNQSRNLMQNKSSTLERRSGFGVVIRRGVREYDPQSTIMIRGTGHIDKCHTSAETASRAQNGQEMLDSQASGNGSGGRSNASRNLSANYQWRDYDDLIREQGNPDDDADSDDEEFEPTSRGRRLDDNGENSDEDESDEDMDDFDDDFESPHRNTRRRQNQTGSGERRSQRRAQRRDTQFVEIGSDDEAIAEFMSTNNTPSGPYARDYNMAGHYWRLTGSKRVKRSWLSRFESDSSYEGRKTYTPQLGDSVVYIPRAHYESISEFPSLSPPWQRWPESAAWPVVRCLVRGIRFRFPYEDYYRKGRYPCNSIVAILTLEVTGIPQLSEDRDFPWPKPSFVEPTRQNVFELSLFEIDQAEFVLPEAQYVGRLESLERSMRDRHMNLNGLEVSVHYAENGDDAEFGSYPATVEGLGEEMLLSHPSLSGSGFGSVNMICQGYEESFSPWELVASNRSPSRPSLSDEDKKLVMDKLNEQLRKSDVSEYFSRPVDQMRYSDYWSMVEIEMSLLFTKRRLESNYYGSKLSVVGDVRLIRDNCIKYNSVANDLSAVASEMCDEFERNVLSIEELSQLISEEEFTTLVNSSQTPESNSRLRRRGTNEISASSEPSYALRERGRTRRRSSLEALPQPEPPSSRRRVLRNEFEAATSRPRRSSRSGDPTAATSRPRRPNRSGDPTPETEVLGRISRRRAGFSPNYGEDAASESAGGGDDSEDERNPAANENTGQDNSSHDNGDTINSRRRSSRRARVDDSNEFGAGGNDGDDEKIGKPTHRSGGSRSRRSAQAYSSEEEEEEESDHEDSAVDSEASDVESAPSEDEDDLDIEAKSPSAKKRTRAAVGQRQSSRTSPRARKSITSAEDLNSPSRRSSRASAKKQSQYEEIDSDFGENEEEPDDSEEEIEEPKEKTRSKRTISYADPSSGSEDEDNVSNQEMTSKKRSVPSSPNQSKKRSKRERKSDDSELPHFEDWPEISLKAISYVSKVIVEEILTLDADQVFATPVLETFPELKKDYLKVVKSPLDLRTIEEERICQYRSIKELQNDLNLMFENCCTFNQAGSELWNYSIAIWHEMNHVFANACGQLDVLLPRRWKP